MFWKLKIEPEKVYAMKIRNAVHITMVSTDPRNSTALFLPIYIRHQGKLHLICTLSESKWDVPLDFKFDSTDDKVEFYLGCQFYWNPELKSVYLSGSEASISISNQNMITTRLLENKDLCKEEFEEKDYENGYIASEKASKRIDKDFLKNRNIKQIHKNNKINSDKNRNGYKKVVKDFCSNEKVDNVEYDNDGDSNDDDDDDDDDDNDDDDDDDDNDTTYDDDNDDGDDDDDDDDGDDDDDDGDDDDDDDYDNDDDDDDDDYDNDDDDDDENEKEDAADSDDDHEYINDDHDNKKETQKENNKKQHITEKRKSFPITKYVPIKGKEKLLENNIKVIEIKRGVGLPAKNDQIAHVCITRHWQIGNKEKIFSISSRKPPYFKLKIGQITGMNKRGIIKLRIGDIRRIIVPSDCEITAFGHMGTPPVNFKNCNIIYDIEVKDITDY